MRFRFDILGFNKIKSIAKDSPGNYFLNKCIL